MYDRVLDDGYEDWTKMSTPTIRQLHQYCQIEGVWAIKGKNCSMKQLGLGLYYIQT